MGDYTLTSGKWFIEVDALADTADFVQVDGLLDLSGVADTLQIGVWAGTPLAETFVIASYGSLSGTFDTEDLSALAPGYIVDYNYGGLNQIALVNPTAIPTPAALPAGLALLTIAAMRRRG